MNRLKEWLGWLVTSSADPLQYSVGLRGLGLGAVTYVMTLATTACGVGLVCLNINVDWLNQVVEFVVKTVEYGLYAVAGIATLYGMGRKLWYTRWAHPAASPQQ